MKKRDPRNEEMGKCTIFPNQWKARTNLSGSPPAILCHLQNHRSPRERYLLFQPNVHVPLLNNSFQNETKIRREKAFEVGKKYIYT